MRKFVLPGLAILLALSLSTCEMAPLGGITAGEGDTAYVFDSKGSLKSVTASFDDSGNLVFPKPSKNNRALFDAMAKASYNYFEAVFHGSTETDGSDPTTVRTTWRFGNSGIITNVPRHETAINYGSAAIPDTPTAAFGASVLFIGREDGDLLAVGLLTHADGAESADITSSTRTVTFTVTSLEAGLSYESHEADETITFKNNHFEDGVEFSAYALSKNISGTGDTSNYIFYFHGFTPKWDGGNIEDGLDLSDNDNLPIINRLAGIKADSGTINLIPRNPAFYYGGKTIEYLSTAHIKNGNNFAAITLNEYSPITDNGLLEIVWKTSNNDGYTSFSLDIPVYAMIKGNNNTNSTTECTHWHIRTGLGDMVSFLDDGSPTALGGSILLKIGSPEEEVLMAPEKIIIRN